MARKKTKSRVYHTRPAPGDDYFALPGITYETQLSEQPIDLLRQAVADEAVRRREAVEQQAAAEEVARQQQAADEAARQEAHRRQVVAKQHAEQQQAARHYAEQQQAARQREAVEADKRREAAEKAARQQQAADEAEDTRRQAEAEEAKRQAEAERTRRQAQAEQAEAIEREQQARRQAEGEQAEAVEREQQQTSREAITEIAHIVKDELHHKYSELFTALEWEGEGIVKDDIRRTTALFCVELFNRTKSIAEKYKQAELIQAESKIAGKDLLHDKFKAPPTKLEQINFKEPPIKLEQIVDKIVIQHSIIHANIKANEPSIVYDGELGETYFDEKIHELLPYPGDTINNGDKCFALFPGVLEVRNLKTVISKTIVIPADVDPHSSFQRIQYTPGVDGFYADQTIIEALHLFGEVGRHLLRNLTPEKAAVLSFISGVEKRDGTYDFEAVGDALDAISVYFS